MRVDGAVVAEIGPGLLVFVGVGRGDGPADAVHVGRKLAHLRIFRDDDGLMNRSLVEVGGSALVVSQFTLYGDTRKGRRPSFVEAAAPEEAEALVREVTRTLSAEGVPVGEGVFGAHMTVELVNDGPVTVMVSSP